MKQKIQKFATLLEAEQIGRLVASGLNCQSNITNAKIRVIGGKKYTKVNVGNSGRYMVENETGNIFGCKGYGVIHRGHFYGTVDTTQEYYWGEYYPVKKANPTPLDGDIPKLTFAPSNYIPEGEMASGETPLGEQLDGNGELD